MAVLTRHTLQIGVDERAEIFKYTFAAQWTITVEPSTHHIVVFTECLVLVQSIIIITNA